MRRIGTTLNGFTQRPRLAGAVLLCAVAASGAIGHRLASPAAPPEPTTRLTLAACGLHPAPAAIAMPLARMYPDASGPAITVGPIEHPGLDAPLPVRLEPSADAAAPLRQEGETLVVPFDPARPPGEIRLVCRYGAVARVEFRDPGVRDMPAPRALSANATPSDS